MFSKLFEKSINIAPNEVTRTLYAWIIRFFLKCSLIIGWTTVISMFVEQYSIVQLPLLLLVQASFTICGMLLFSFLLERFEARKMIVFNALSAIFLIFISAVFHQSSAVFFPCIVIAAGFFLPQLSIFISHYIEDFFTVPESERTFPVIESADTIAGIVGGAVLFQLSHLIGPGWMVSFWAIGLILLIGVMFLLQPRTSQFYNFLYEMKVLPRHKRGNWHGLIKSLGEVRKVKFIKILVIVYFLQWILTHLLEFQYTKIVDQAVLGNGESSHTGGLAEGLGSLHMIFFGFALIMQLFFASRILRAIGTFGAFMFHSILTFMSSVMMLFGFGYFTTVFARNNYEVSGILNRNAYEVSYYAVQHGTQRSLRQLFEGLIGPIATIICTLMLILAQAFFVESDSVIAINLLFFLVTILLMYFSYKMKNGYTSMVRHKLMLSDNKIAKMQAIDILTQKGHIHALEVLLEVLEATGDSDICSKIIRVIHKIGDHRAIIALAHCLQSKDKVIVRAAVKALADFPDLDKRISDKIFSRHRVVNDLKKVFELQKDYDIKFDCLRALIRLDNSIVPFLLDVLGSADPPMISRCLKVIGGLKDAGVIPYLKKYLHNADPSIRAEAIIALSQFRECRHEVIMARNHLIHDSHKKSIYAVCDILSDLGTTEIARVMVKHVNDPSDIKLHALLGLLKLGYYKVANRLSDLLLDGNIDLDQLKRPARTLGTHAKRVLADNLQKAVLRKSFIDPIGFRTSRNVLLENVSDDLLQHLYKLYVLFDCQDDIELIETIIHYRKKVKNNVMISTDLSPEYILGQP